MILAREHETQDAIVDGEAGEEVLCVSSEVEVEPTSTTGPT